MLDPCVARLTLTAALLASLRSQNLRAMSDDVGEAAAFKEVIDDLALRFVVNCPPEEQESFERLLFQVEAAFWFYDDQYREIWPNTYPKMTMLDFAQAMFKHCELLTKFAPQVPKIYEAFTEYKNQIPTCGAVLLNGDRTKALFVQGFKRHSWLFPKGKIDKDEDKASCAAREVLEEVGFDIAGLLDADAFIEVEPMKGHALVRLYIVDGVAEGTHFETHTKKEISGIEWFKLAELPTSRNIGDYKTPFQKRFWYAAPFVRALNTWIGANKKKKKKGGAAAKSVAAAAAAAAAAAGPSVSPPPPSAAGVAAGAQLLSMVMGAPPTASPPAVSGAPPDGAAKPKGRGRKAKGDAAAKQPAARGHPFLDFAFDRGPILEAIK